MAGYNGDININILEKTVVLTSNQGDIKVGSAIYAVGATTNYGNIDVTFAQSNAFYTPENGIKSIVATTQNGHIWVKGLQHGIITSTDSGRVSLEYDKIVGENTITANSGVVNIVVPCPTKDSEENAYAFNLKVRSDVNYDIKVGVVGELGTANPVDYNGSGTEEFSNIYNSASSTSNMLNVSSTTGKIKIRSRDLIGF